MPDLELAPRREIPPVGSDDVARVWHFFLKISVRAGDQETPEAAIGIASPVITQLCEGSNSDPLAVFLRVSIVEHLFRQGALAEWSTGEEPARAVFECAARFPLPNGMENFDSSRFLAMLRDSGR